MTCGSLPKSLSDSSWRRSPIGLSDRCREGRSNAPCWAAPSPKQAPLLLLDEPTAALDVGHQQQVLELIDELRTEHALTVISAVHDLTLAGQFAERLVLLSDGRLVAEGTAHRVLTESVISKHYGASVRILEGPGGSVVVIPVRSGRDRSDIATEKVR